MTTEENAAPDVQKLEENKNIDGLIEALTDQKSDLIRIQVARAMGALQDPKFIDPLLTLFYNHDVSYEVHYNVIQALGEFQSASEEIKKRILVAFQAYLVSDISDEVRLAIMTVASRLFDHNTLSELHSIKPKKAPSQARKKLEDQLDQLVEADNPYGDMCVCST